MLTSVRLNPGKCEFMAEIVLGYDHFIALSIAEVTTACQPLAMLVLAQCHLYLAPPLEI